MTRNCYIKLIWLSFVLHTLNPMDIDDTVDVPDTPDRLAKSVTNKWSAVEEENHSSSHQGHLLSRKFSEEKTEIQPVLMDRGSRKLSLHGAKCTSSSGNSLYPINLAFPSTESSSSSKNNPQPVAFDSRIRTLSSDPPRCSSRSGNSHYSNNSAGLSVASSFLSKSPLLFRKKTPSSRSGDCIHSQHLPIETPSFNSKNHVPSFQDNKPVGLTERSPHGSGFGGMFGCRRFQFTKKTGLSDEPSFSNDPANFSTARSNASVAAIDLTGSISKLGHRQGGEILETVQNKPAVNGSICIDPIVSPRINKQKRLVWNGCISPCNVAKAKQPVEKCKKGIALDNNDSVTSGDSPVSVDIKEIISEDHTSRSKKGKGVIIYPCTSKEPELKNKHSYHRSSSAFNKKAMETSDYITGAGRHTEETGEWRNTRHRTRELNSPSSHEERSETRETEVLRSVYQYNEDRMTRKGKGKRSSVPTDDDNHKSSNFISSDHVSLPGRPRILHPRTRLGQLDGRPFTAKKLIKRQKQGCTSSNLGECSMSVSDDSEVVVLSSSAEPLNTRSTSGNHLQQIIEVDELFPDLRPNAHDEDARARQVESDELLACELQEKLYNDVPVPGVAEVDAHIALALQHQFNLIHASSSRDSLIPSLHSQSQFRPSSTFPRRGSQARASMLGRMTRARNRFPGQPRTLLPPGGGTSLFPANMDVDMRMHILGALEAFSEMEVGTGVLQTHRELNENDYETLLALDENIGQHGGASVRHINGLPLSTIQNSNFDEACAICLETPTIGETIRHLPCLHKFHKDCIDPWLRRKTSCPICKSSIT